MPVRKITSFILIVHLLAFHILSNHSTYISNVFAESSNQSEDNFIEDECEVIKEKQCVDYNSKTIDGFPVTRCWKYEETSRCVGKEKNYCQTFEDNRGCEEQHAKCLEQANVSKICKNFEKKFKCGEKAEEDAEIKHIDTEYLVKRDERDLSKCSESAFKNCVIKNERCLEGPETRNINGKDVYKDCWKWDRDYYCKQNSFIDECKELKKKCKEVSRECLHEDERGNCEHFDVTYECEEKSKDKLDCIAGRFCIGGICETHERFQPNNFGENIGTLIALANMKREGMEGCNCPEGKEKCNPDDIDPKTCKFFIGEEHKCTKFRGQWLSYAAAAISIYMSWGAIPIGINPAHGVGAFGTKLGSMSAMEAAKFAGAQAAKVGLAGMARVDCCAMDGLLAAFCGGKARDLKAKRQQRSCVKVGRYKKKLGLIVVTSYCCFKSKLMKVIQEQGRAQLGLTFGTAKNPDCRGLNLEEIQRIDFSKIDFREVIKDFKEEAENAVNSNIDQSKFEAQARKIQEEYKDKKFDVNTLGEKAKAFNVKIEEEEKVSPMKDLIERKVKRFYKAGDK